MMLMMLANIHSGTSNGRPTVFRSHTYHVHWATISILQPKLFVKIGGRLKKILLYFNVQSGQGLVKQVRALGIEDLCHFMSAI